MGMETPLARAKGLGSAKSGTYHWWFQRLTAIMLVPLSLWFMASMASLINIDYSVIRTWIATPVTTVMLILFVISLFYHAQLGLQVIIEDYIHSEWQKVANIILIRFIAFIAALAAIFAIMRLFLEVH